MIIIKTYEGFFDFLKKKNKVTFDDVIECLYDLTDEHRIKNQLNFLLHGRNSLSGIFYYGKGLNHNDIMNDELYRDKPFKIRGNSITFNMIYFPNEISDNEVNELLLDCKLKLKMYDCEMSFFIGWGDDEGGSSDKEWSDFLRMIGKTVMSPEFVFPQIQRNITVKIKSPSGFNIPMDRFNESDDKDCLELTHESIDSSKNWIEKKSFNDYKMSELEVMVMDCKDILLELQDMGLTTNLQFFYNPWIIFTIWSDKESDKYIIDDVVERLKNYLSEYGLFLSGEPTFRDGRIWNPTTFTPVGKNWKCELKFVEK
jgi:hypothetical protein